MTVLGPESTRREYAARMNRVVDHIQSHLNEPLALERVAAIACFSGLNFHRLFSAWMGETLQVFVHRLRLERAAQMLVFDKARSVSEVAMECGFSSPGAFARAFKTAFRFACRGIPEKQDLDPLPVGSPGPPHGAPHNRLPTARRSLQRRHRPLPPVVLEALRLGRTARTGEP